MRVLSRRSNLPKTVACGYSEGAGFVVLTEPSLLFAGRSAPHVGDPSTRRLRAVPQAPRALCALGCLRLGHQPATGTHQLGPSAEATATASGADDSSRRRRQGGVPAHLSTGGCLPSRPSAGHLQGRKMRAATASGAGRRHLSTTKTSAPPRRRRLCRLVVSVTEAEAKALLADNETAQALQHGCGDDCWRSASLAALHARPPALH